MSVDLQSEYNKARAEWLNETKTLKERSEAGERMDAIARQMKEQLFGALERGA